MPIIITTGAEPAVTAKPGHYEMEHLGGGTQKPVWKQPVDARPAGPFSVMLVVPGKDPVYITPDEADQKAAELVEAAKKVRAALAPAKVESAGVV
jgi:hypothetical protein